MLKTLVYAAAMGGSAIGGDLLKAYAQEKQMLQPVQVSRSYALPCYVGPGTLVLTISYSGNTEETLSAYEEAQSQGARVVAITSGGKLEEWAQRDNVPVVKLPKGLAPRASIGYLFTPLAMIAEKAGWMRGVVPDLNETVDLLTTMMDSLVPDVDASTNQSKRIACLVYGSLPVIWAVSGSTEAAGMRLKAQINENAKTPAYLGLFPELNHNEIVGMEKPKEILDNVILVILHHPSDHKRVRVRMDLTRELVKDKVKGILELDAQSENWLAAMFSLIYLGDWVSFYLAQLNGVNPMDIRSIDLLKQKMVG